MIKSKGWINAAALAAAAGFGTGAGAAPVVYTLRTVADGQLGSWTFYEALVTFQLTGSTRSVQTQSGPGGVPIYTNGNGTATVTVDDGYHRAIATFAQGEVFVHYDPATGVIGFGSPISPTYPLSLGCTNYGDTSYTTDCAKGDWGQQGRFFEAGQYNGTADAQADVASYPADSVYSSLDALNLHTDLVHNTLLTGIAHSCATTYTVSSFNELQACPSPAPRGLHTNKGDFYLQDKFGIYFSGEANTGALQVEVFREDD